jgi:hypothetical protein
LPCTPGSRPSRPARDAPTATGCAVVATASTGAAVHRIAITQLRLAGPGQAYHRRRRAQGDGTGEAVRAPKRRITRAVYQQLKLAQQRQPTTSATAA